MGDEQGDDSLLAVLSESETVTDEEGILNPTYAVYRCEEVKGRKLAAGAIDAQWEESETGYGVVAMFKPETPIILFVVKRRSPCITQEVRKSSPETALERRPDHTSGKYYKLNGG